MVFHAQVAETIRRMAPARHGADRATGQCGDGVIVAEHSGRWFAISVVQGEARVEPGANMALEPRDTLHFRGCGRGRGIRGLGALLRSLQMAGALERITEKTVAYTRERVQFGRSIGSFQAIQQNLAVLAGQAAAARAATEFAAEAVGDQIRLAPTAAAKIRTGEAVGLATGVAHQIHGAIGFQPRARSPVLYQAVMVLVRRVRQRSRMVIVSRAAFCG
jgi:acyl-CoA dehydrogenase